MYSRPVSRSFRRNAVLGISGDADGDAGGERRVPARRDPTPASSDPASSSSSASIAGFVATICETSNEPLDGSVGEAFAAVPER